MLVRGTHALRPIIAAARANNRIAQHLFRRDFAGYVVRGANAGTIKRLEAEMSEVGARLVYLPYTWRISTTRIRKALDALSA